MSVFLTIGTYDGVHLGHRKIIRTLTVEGRKSGLGSAIAYFPLPPKFFFSGERKNCLITLPGEREARLRRLGVRRITKLPFTRTLAGMGAREFFEKVILKGHAAAGLCVGLDFAFGKDRSGDIRFLRRHCRAAGIRFKALSFVTSGGHKVSSSHIRTLLRHGSVEKAGRCLGWRYSVSGKVVRGAGIGRRLGFPTANLAPHPAKILPPGTFAVRVRLGKGVYTGVANVGLRPTIAVQGASPLLEVHILDFDRDIYGRRLEVEFLKRLRAERKFGSREALQEQILSDIRTARKYLEKHRPLPS